jgi:hypothetical protein
MHFEILGEISAVETIATGAGIREISRLRKRYGRGRWRKRKGIAEVRLASGEIVGAESSDALLGRIFARFCIGK